MVLPVDSGSGAARSWLFRSLRGYERLWLRGDLVAGLTLVAILVPQALAYASIAGVSPVVGLYAAPGALLLYAALGSSRLLIVGPMAAAAALSAATVADLILLARVVGQVRDVLERTSEDRDLTASYPTIAAAVKAAGSAGGRVRGSHGGLR
jgi:MFS superfamily sulfate permease-like transporter